MVLPDPFRGMGTRRNSAETQQSGHTPRSGPEVKNGRSSARDGAEKAHMLDNPKRGELNSADNVRKRWKKNFSSVLSCIGKTTKEVCDRGSEVGTVYNWRNREEPVPH